MPRSAGLVGRAAELDRLVDLAAAVAAGGTGRRFVMVSGEPGIGKSRLVDELATTVPSGVRVLRGRADELDAAPFGLWLPVLARLTLPRPDADASVSANEQRWELVDLLASALTGPSLVVLEDLHWADDDSMWVLEQLLDRCSDRALAVVATTRPSPASGASRWHALYRRAEVVALDGLDVDEVAELASQLGAPRADAPELCARTGGNPLFVREQVLSGRPTVPPSIEPLLAASIERLSADAAAVVSLLALADPTTGRPVLAAAASIELADLDRRIDEAVRADVLGVFGDAIRFRHDLLAEAVARRTGESERARLHVALADAHARVGGPDADHAEARHRLSAVPTQDATAAAEGALAAADRLRSRGRFSEAAALLQLARSTVTGRPDLTVGVQATVAVSEAESRWMLDEYEAALVASARAVELAAAAGDPSLEARALVAATTHHNPFFGDPDSFERLAALDDEVADDDTVDPAVRIRLRGRRAVLTLALPGRTDEGVALADDAIARARRLGDPSVLVAALSDRFQALRTPADLAARADAAAEILVIARAGRRPDLARLGHEWSYAAHMHEGDLSGAIAALDHLEVLAAIMPSPLWRYGAAIRRACVLGLLGDYEGLVALADAGRALAHGIVSEEEARSLELGLRTSASRLYRRGDRATAPLLARMIELSGDVPVLFLQAMLAVAEADLGDLAAARRRLAPWLGRFATAFDGIESLPALAALATVTASSGWSEAAAELRALLAPFAGRMPVGTGGVIDLSIDHHLGALALVTDDIPRAIAHAQDAVAFARRMRSPLLEARALALLATADHGAGDMAAAESAFDAATTLAEPLGVRLPPLGDARAPHTPDATRTHITTAARTVSLRLDGGRWSIGTPFGDAHVADVTGMKQLIALVTSPGTEISAVDLAHIAGAQPIVVTSDLGPVLDARAKREYRQRIAELHADIDEADAANDIERAAKHRVELDAILDQLRAAVGLGGRDRPQASGNERARVNAARNIRRAIAAITKELPELGAHLDVSIRTGHRCSYSPEPAAALTWAIERTER